MDVESTMLPLGTKLPEFNLKGIDEKNYKNSDFSENNGLLVMFICNHCPFVKHINKELVDFTNDLMAKNIGVIGINSNDSSQEKYAEDSIEKMKEYASELGYQFPYVVDEDQTVAKNFTAQCTPDFFLFNSDSELIYRGQFDFSRPRNDKPVTGESLAQAVDAAHCPIFPTAASRRSLDRVSVPVWLIILSDQLRVIALVSRYLTN
jgi:peroxiredoxin